MCPGILTKEKGEGKRRGENEWSNPELRGDLTTTPWASAVVPPWKAISLVNVYSGADEGSEIMAEALASILPGCSLCFLWRLGGEPFLRGQGQNMSESSMHEDSLNYLGGSVGWPSAPDAVSPPESYSLFHSFGQ